MSVLAINGGKAAFTADHWSNANPVMRWPVYTEEDEAAIVDVLRKRKMSGTDITKRFEKAYAEYVGAKYVLGYCSGTASIIGLIS